ncbi:uncharacterized protein LOC118745869 [Rhagoletis pomonella]|nr:uncharacterized protein LOC118745869 [Rhagoletis pomonella]
MRLIRKDKPFSQRITRWDRIRKRNDCKNSCSINSGIVQYFFWKEYISPYDNSVLCGKNEPNKALNPLVVMDIRHEMFQKTPRKSALVTVGGQRTLDACISHNLVVEDRYINNELKKIRQQLRNNTKRNTDKKEFTEEHKQDVSILDNSFLIQGLERATKHMENFYTTPLDVLQAIEVLSATETNKNDTQEHKLTPKNGFGIIEAIFTDEVDKKKYTMSAETVLSKHINPQAKEYEYKIVSDSNLKIENPLIYKFSNEYKNPIAPNTATDSYLYQTRCVRFDESVEVRNFNRDSSKLSNTSCRIDLAVSDITEEALFELQIAAEEKLTQKTRFESVANKPPPTDFNKSLKCSQKSLKVKNASELLIIKKINNANQVDYDHITPEEVEEESISSFEENLSITQLFQPRANTTPTLLRKYFFNWIHFVTIEKIDRENVSIKDNRIHKISLFLDKIRKEKLRLMRSYRQFTAALGRRAAQPKPGVSTRVTKKYLNK